MATQLLGQIDEALRTVPGLNSGYGAYAGLLDRYEAQRPRSPRAAWAALETGFVDLAARRYAARTRRAAELVRFSDGANQCLFDLTYERTVLMFGRSRDVAANSRDNAYHAGYPRAGDGDDKGHALSHAQGGLEGGPNYFKQSRMLNQSRSERGKLWRSMESYLAAHADLPAFVRLIYAANSASDRPEQVEYCLMNGRRQFRAVIFPN